MTARLSAADLKRAEEFTHNVVPAQGEESGELGKALMAANGWITRLVSEARQLDVERASLRLVKDGLEERLRHTAEERDAAVTKANERRTTDAQLIAVAARRADAAEEELATRNIELAQAEAIAVELNRNMHEAHAARDRAEKTRREADAVAAELRGELTTVRTEKENLRAEWDTMIGQHRELAERIQLQPGAPWKTIRTVVLQLWDRVGELQEQLTTRVGARNTRIGELDGALRKVGVNPATVGGGLEMQLLHGWSTAATNWPMAQGFTKPPPASPEEMESDGSFFRAATPAPWALPALHIDPEVGVMNAVYAALSPLDTPAQNAVLSWVGRRLERDQQTNR